MKKCKSCQITKSPDLFSQDKRNKDGRGAHCKECTNAINRAWIKANPDRNREIKRASKKRCYTIEKRRREYNAPGYREKQAERMRKRRAADPSIHRIQAKQRKKHVALRTPNWLTEVDKQYIRDIYRVAQIFSENSAENYHVDHIIPLRGKRVSGLHVPTNLRILEAQQNQQKHATFG